MSITLKADHQRFDKSMEREMLISERARATILAALMSFALMVALFFFINPELLKWLLPVAPPFQLLSLIVWLLAYEVILIVQTSRFLRDGGSIPNVVRYISALLEISMVTILLFYARDIFGPMTPFLPPAYLYYIFIALSALRLDFWLSLYTGMISAAEYGYILFTFSAGLDPVTQTVLAAPGMHLGRIIVMLAAGIATAFVARQIRRQVTKSLEEVQERNRVIGVFGQHVSPQVVERILDQQVALTSETREVCVMFLDIRDFTHFSENRPPDEVVAYLNSLFEVMVEVVNRHDGIVNKFLGDGFMAVFGAPISSGKERVSAVNAALEILQAVEQASTSGSITSTRIGIGLHAGSAVTGPVGSRDRQEYTIIGDVVNLASRVESLNKEHGSRLLVTGSVWQGLGGSVKAESLGQVEIRGHDQKVEIFKLA
jgi:adenylate cyclase